MDFKDEINQFGKRPGAIILVAVFFCPFDQLKTLLESSANSERKFR